MHADGIKVATAHFPLRNSVLFESLPYSIRGLGQYATVSDMQNILVPKLDSHRAVRDYRPSVKATSQVSSCGTRIHLGMTDKTTEMMLKIE
jgi:hypothetical protein